ncbi:MAG: hypothetical protein KDC79_16130 [Cyclobacteriaceae bacterium]|nr:hypothetical protein [Cyclobacteriaceae bacterium]
MKRVFTILFVLLYLQASVGVTINLHYCMGGLADIKVFRESKGCVCEDFEKEGDCCDDESYYYHLDGQQDFVKTIQIDSPVVAYVCMITINTNEKTEVATKVNTELFDLPPPPKQPIWLLACSPTFYG